MSFGDETPEQPRPHLASGMAKRGKSTEEIDRALALQAVPEAQKPPPGPGRGHKSRVHNSEEETARHDGGEFSGRVTERLRAINRAPDAVKDAYREGRIGQALAAILRELLRRMVRWAATEPA